MKLTILFDIKNEASGGGNSFLRSLSYALMQINSLEKSYLKAETILVNSHHNLFRACILKFKLKSRPIFIHRIDGPVHLIRGRDYWTDYKIWKFNELFADGTIYQSQWSKKKNLTFQRRQPQIYTIIHNASDFSHNIKNINKKPSNSKKIKLISTCWSTNINKGRETYEYLDSHLNFDLYDYTFVGNVNANFKNINKISVVSPNKLKNILASSDIFITASKNDPCSNSLIEALTLKIPSIGKNDGGHPELIGQGGLVFNENEELIEKIAFVAENLNSFKNKIHTNDILQVAKNYVAFAEHTRVNRAQNTNLSKAIFRLGFLVLLFIELGAGRFKTIFKKIIIRS